jgi:hypothetical protein
MRCRQLIENPAAPGNPPLRLLDPAADEKR